MRRLLRKLAWPVVLLAACVLAYLFAVTRPVEVETGTVRRGPIEDYVSEQAITRLHTTRLVSAPSFGIAGRIELEEGDTVTAGQLITTIRDTELQAKLRRAGAQIEEIEGYLEGIDVPLPKPSEVAAAGKRAATAALAVKAAEHELETARHNLHLAEKEFRRAKALCEQGVLPEDRRDKAERDYEVARQAEAAAQVRLASARIEHEVAQLQKQVLLESMDDTRYLRKVYGARITGTPRDT